MSTHLLNQAVLQNSATLMKTFNDIRSQIVSETITLQAMTEVHDELHQFATYVRETDNLAGLRFQFQIPSLMSSFGATGTMTMAERGIRGAQLATPLQQLELLLSSFDEPLLAHVRSRLPQKAGDTQPSPAAPVTAEDEVGLIPAAAAVAGGYDVQAPVVEPEPDPNAFPQITDPAKRIPLDASSLARDQENVARARSNLNDAFERLASDYSHTVLGQVRRHVEAIISGEIDAPVERRGAIIAYLAQSVVCAVTYIHQVVKCATDAQLTDGGPLITVLPDLEIVQEAEPTSGVDSKSDFVPKSTPARGTAKELADKFYNLRTTYAAELELLAKANPGAFGPEALKQLDLMVQIAHHVEQNIRDPRERNEHIAQAIENGTIPKTLIPRRPKDKAQPGIHLPPSRFQDGDIPRHWARPIDTFLLDLTTADPKDMIPADPLKYPLEEKLNDFRQSLSRLGMLSPEIKKNLLAIDALIETDREEARMSFLRQKFHFIRDRLVSWLHQHGIQNMDNFMPVVERLTGSRNLARAEEVMDFATQWILKLKGTQERIDDVVVALRAIGENGTLREFQELAKKAITLGQVSVVISATSSLELQVEKYYQNIKRQHPVVLAPLMERLEGVISFLLEAARTLPANGFSNEQKTRLAETLPPASALLHMKMNQMTARELLRQFGIPVPGDANVYALGAGSTPAYLPAAPSASKAPQLPGTK